LVIFLFSPRRGIIWKQLKRTARTRNLRRRGKYGI
jgi:hypothetical protein